MLGAYASSTSRGFSVSNGTYTGPPRAVNNTIRDALFKLLPKLFGSTKYTVAGPRQTAFAPCPRPI